MTLPQWSLVATVLPRWSLCQYSNLLAVTVVVMTGGAIAAAGRLGKAPLVMSTTVVAVDGGPCGGAFALEAALEPRACRPAKLEGPQQTRAKPAQIGLCQVPACTQRMRSRA